MSCQTLFALALGPMVATVVSAQVLPITDNDPVAEAPIKVGALGLGPRIGLTNLGWDSNVFNQPTNPRGDFTFAIEPGTAVWLRTGRGILRADANLEFVYFNEYSSQGSIGHAAKAQYEWAFNRFRPFVSGSTLATEQRPGFEIDARPRHYENEFHTGAEMRVFSKSKIRFTARQMDYRFEDDSRYNGQALDEELNRTLKGMDLGWRQRLTVLTTFVAQFSRETERFEFNTVRNSDTTRLLAGFELDRLALIRGRAFAGFRRLTPADGGALPEFSGVIANVNVSYSARTQTRFTAAVDRDVKYSYDPTTPFYIQTSWTGSLTQKIIGPWDAQISGGRDRLNYEARPSAVEARTDYVGRFGGGIGYSLNEDTRLSFDVNSFYRRSPRPGNEYGAIRGGVSITYGY